MTKSIERKIDLISGDTLKKAGGLYPTSSTKQKPYGKASTTTKTIQDKSKIISSSQRYASTPKKLLPGTTKKGDKTPMQTPIQKQKYKKDETHKGISNPKSPNPQIPNPQSPNSQSPIPKSPNPQSPFLFIYCL